MVEKKELARHWGKSYVMEAVRYQGTPPMITALANGELEIANLAYSTLGIAIENAGISDLRVISDEFRDGVPGYFSNQFFVRKDSGIKTIADLKGKVLATNVIGAGVDIAMKAGLRKHGLIDKRDFTVIEAPFPTMPAMLNDKKADLVTAVMPFALNPLLNQIGVPLYDQTEGMGTTQFTVWTARKSWIDKNRAALVDYMEDMIRIVRWYLDPKNHDEAAQDSLEPAQDPTRALRLAVHQAGLLSRPEHDAGPRGAATQCRHHLGAGLRQVASRRQAAFRSRPDRRSREKAEMRLAIPAVA